MQKLSFYRHAWMNIASIMLLFPAIIFILISVLKYNMGFEAPYDTIAPIYQRWGIHKTLGWNINLLILIGPLIALIISLFQVLGLNWNNTIENFRLQITIQKKWLPVTIIFLGALSLASLFFYLFAENCNCI